MASKCLPITKIDDAVPKDFTTALILGGGYCAPQLARRLSAEGISVIYVGKRDPNLDHEKHGAKIVFMADGVLRSISGVIGAFEAAIETTRGIEKVTAGFVVIAQPPLIAPKFSEYGVKPQKNVVSLSRFLDDLRAEKIDCTSASEWRHVAFLAGLDGAADAATFARVFDCIDILSLAQPQLQCYVFAQHVKVAENGLEARYRKIREAGTLFFVFDTDFPTVDQTTDTLRIVFSDPHLSSEFELAPDMLIIDENLLPPSSVAPILTMAPSSLFSKPYLTPASPRYPGVATAKAGVFAVGAARGEFYEPKIEEDVESVIAAIKKIVALHDTGGSGLVAVVDPATCTLCLTCVRTCPHGAIQFRASARVDRDACLGCGICSSECPMEAIALTQREVLSGNGPVAPQHCIQVTARYDGKITAFLCEHSAASAFAELPPSLKSLVAPLIVPCAGAVGELDIMQAFLNGAKGVIVAGCFRGNCASIYGTDRASHRVVLVQKLLADAGLSPALLAFVASASNAPHNLATAIAELSSLGPCLPTLKASSSSIL